MNHDSSKISMNMEKCILEIVHADILRRSLEIRKLHTTVDEECNVTQEESYMNLIQWTDFSSSNCFHLLRL